ncbi:thioredoxin family protein [Ectobacillus sp. SYSU M60031]|uniref:Thioredoxin family protein n=1 Tax=Ectobacillus ponti TaxID=2961894 RepID=A0AA41X5D0_9BACI|nr:thioredoxin family protein [Ectobacillus ponti]MCP8967488.1 thioredoxin family protein [Ectobacillus ponti]
MKTLESMEQFQAAKQEEKTVFLFSADWCPDCVFIKPFMPEVEEKFSDFTFYFVDRDQFMELCQELNVFGIPSFVAYSKGEERGRFVNKDRKTQEQIEDFLAGLSA